MNSLKPEILKAIKQVLSLRVEAARKAMAEAQESANSEEKSSAGDKYETSRAMSQNQRDMNARQMLEAHNAVMELEQYEKSKPYSNAFPGALIQTQDALYFMGPGLGKLASENGIEFISLSAKAPLGNLFLGKKAGESVVFQGKEIRIVEVM